MSSSQQPLPLPNPGDWTDRTGAARILGVDETTVGRMVRARRLTPYACGVNLTMYWVPGVKALAEARRIAREGVES